MVRDIIFQISVFGDFTSIIPDADTIQAMIARFSNYGLLPNIFQEQDVTFSPNLELTKADTMNRLQMVSFEENINVIFARNRLDINRISTDLTISLTNDDLYMLLDILNKAASGLSFSRIGFNTTSLLDNPADSIMQKIQPRISSYTNPSELQIMVNKREDVSIGESLNEKSNIILNVQKTMGQLLIMNKPLSVDKALILQFDINTAPENSEPRFFSEQTKTYVVSAEQIRRSVLRDLIS